jgi:predicted GNAT family acetyltransferase
MEIKEEKERFVLLNDEQEEAGEMTWSNAGPEIMIIDHTFVNDFSQFRSRSVRNKKTARFYAWME